MRLHRAPVEPATVGTAPGVSSAAWLDTFTGWASGAPCRRSRRKGRRANSVARKMSISTHRDTNLPTNLPTNRRGTQTNPFGDSTILL